MIYYILYVASKGQYRRLADSLLYTSKHSLIQSPSAKPEIKKLMSQNDDEFAEGFIQILPTEAIQLSRVDLPAVIKVPATIKNLVTERVLERVKKIIH